MKKFKSSSLCCVTNTANILQEDCILPLFSAMCSVWETASITLILLCFNFDCLEDETLLIVCLLVGFLEESKDSARATFVTESAGFIMYDFIISLLCFSWMPCNALLCDGRKVKKEETHFTALKKSHYFLELFSSIIILSRLKKTLLDLMCIWHNL